MPLPLFFRSAALWAGLFSLGMSCSSPVFADSVEGKPLDDSVAAELASFTLHPGLEIALFADETNGVANPVALQWDRRGRLWVLCTLAYAQLQPGQLPDDKLFILEDRDGDGRADHTSVFASGLNMPSGFVLGPDGVYLGESEDLVRLRDTDGDDKADVREVVLTGFGTADTHQNIRNLTWGPDGTLAFCQGLHTESHVETPWGLVGGDTAGFWRFHPVTMRLEPFCFPALASQNPCGVAFDRWGAMFVKSNNKEVGFVTPGLIPTTHQLDLMAVSNIGSTPGKSMGGEIAESGHLPEWLRGQLLIAGYYSHHIHSFTLQPEGAGFRRVEPVELLRSTHQSFRPVEIRLGPEGALYVADWYNPIIGHYQASLRHPDRDHEHGRIWRITAQGRPLMPRPDIAGMTDTSLRNQLTSAERWNREQARLEILRRHIGNGTASPLPGIETAANDAEAFEFSGLAHASGELTAAHIERLLAGKEPGVRAFAGRLLGQSGTAFPHWQSSLGKLVADPDPRVRLEAVVACGNLPEAEAMGIALQVLDQKMDQHLDYALTQATHALAPRWLPAVRQNRLTLEKPEQLAYALEAYGGSEAAETARDWLTRDLAAPVRQRFAGVLARLGTAEDLRQLFEAPDVAAPTLAALREAAQRRGLRPAGDPLPRLQALLQPREAPGTRALAMDLAGWWKIGDLAPAAKAALLDHDAPEEFRAAAAGTYARLGGSGAGTDLKSVAESSGTVTRVRLAALDALAGLEVKAAAECLTGVLSKESFSSEAVSAWLVPLVNRKGGDAALTQALRRAPLPGVSASVVSTALVAMGRGSAELKAALESGPPTPGVQPYDAAYVADLAAEVKEKGSAEKGRALFQQAELGCVACHQVGGKGGMIGPDLSTVGGGLPVDLLIESVLWPDRQLKEGYFALSVTTKEGRVFTGYRDREENGVLWVRDTATKTSEAVPVGQIASRQNIGTLMPFGLTQKLSREELRDLIAFLAGLKG